MRVYTKYPPVDVITNLMLLDLYDAKQFSENHEHMQVRKAFTPVAARIKNNLEANTRLLNLREFTKKTLEAFCASNLANAREAFNVANMQRRFIENDGREFCINVYKRMQCFERIWTDKPAEVCTQITESTYVENTTAIRVILHRDKPNPLTGSETELIFESKTNADDVQQMFRNNTGKYLDLALESANVELILKFARRPPQETMNHYHHYRRYR